MIYLFFIQWFIKTTMKREVAAVENPLRLTAYLQLQTRSLKEMT